MRLVQIVLVLLALHVSPVQAVCSISPSVVSTYPLLFDGSLVWDKPQYAPYWLSYWSPFVDINCDNNLEYVTLELNVDPVWFPVLSQYAMNKIVYFYMQDQWGDFQQVGTGVPDKASNVYKLYGGTHYAFTFSTYSLFSEFKITTSPLPNCSYNFGEKINKADNSDSALFQCGLFADGINNPPYSGLGGCVPHRCQNYPNQKIVAFCKSTYNDTDCLAKAEVAWFIGTEYDLSSLPKIMIYLTLLIIFFIAIAAGLLMR